MRHTNDMLTTIETNQESAMQTSESMPIEWDETEFGLLEFVFIRKCFSTFSIYMFRLTNPVVFL